MRRAATVLVLVALAATACAGSGAEPRPEASARGRLLPEERLELPQYDPATFRALLAELKGTPVVVNVWGSWCPPCRAEAPLLSEISRKYEGRIQFIGVDILDERGAAREFILEFDWPYPSIFDPTGAIRDALGYLGQPVTVVYDRLGRLAFEHNGTISASLLEREIREVL